MHRPFIAIVGLGYVGAPLALAFSKHYEVVGFDINRQRIDELRSGYDRTLESTPEEIKTLVAERRISFTSHPEDISEADIFVITVPTPVSDAQVPDMSCVMDASRTVGKVMKKGAIVVYESTVYPGASEDECVPVLVEASRLNYPGDFAIGYSPERINPGDQIHTLTNTTKIVSGDRPEVLDILANLYGKITTVHRAPTIKVAESAKVLENVQRDVNIALMNEVYQIFSRCGVNTHAVLEAAGTKWNFLKFTPGLVGGHCISVDPYYLSHKAMREGFPAKLILTARQTNDSMPAFVVDQLVRKLASTIGLSSSTVVTVLGVTFKENVPDVRNSKVTEIVNELSKFGTKVQVVDPLAHADEVVHELGLELTSISVAQANPADAVILAVPHDEFLENGGWDLISRLAKPGKALVMDFKGTLDTREAPSELMVIS
ncbi:UDP-glucose 6-dehydrogenase [Caballeronia calidae]|uniref:UDP-glucose 6-dehydrogenase n=2 Tax=Caballeronia calidae TaxID=1777139 RepID=A0A158E0Q6_9BURK|nr:UDP-glucose 6-dehydrogenase [Caballeronia calidae]